MGEELVLSAFRQRFRPHAEGPLCDEDRALMAGLAAIDATGRNA
jgi:N-acetylmuramoyl-L-alanine amidase